MIDAKLYDDCAHIYCVDLYGGISENLQDPHYSIGNREMDMLIVLAALIALSPVCAPSPRRCGKPAARYAHLSVAGTPLAFLGYRWTPWIFVVLALVELVGDQLPATPSRKVPVQFGTRIVMGALAGGAIAAQGALYPGLAAGAVGAVIGTLGGAAVPGPAGGRVQAGSAGRADRGWYRYRRAWLLACWLA